MIPTVWKENLLNVFSPQSPHIPHTHCITYNNDVKKISITTNIVYGHTGICPCTFGSCRVWLTLLSGSPRWVVDHGNVANVYSPHTHPSPVQWHQYTQMDSVLINRHAREGNVLIFQRICQIPGELVSFECEHKHLLQFSQNGSFFMRYVFHTMSVPWRWNLARICIDFRNDKFQANEALNVNYPRLQITYL